MRDNLRIVKVIEKTRFAPLSNHYEQAEVKGWRGVIARLAWRFLHKHGGAKIALGRITTHTYDRETHGKALLSQLASAVDHVIFDQNGRFEDYAFVVGSATFSDILKIGPMLFQPGFTVPLPTVNYVKDGYRGKIRDIPVHVVNHVEGFALIPRVIVERVVMPANDPRRGDGNNPRRGYLNAALDPFGS